MSFSVVPDTNVVIARALTEHPKSPNLEFFRLIHFHLEIYPVDEKDICFLLCAINGRATHIVTYDNHFLSIADEIRFIFSVEVCKPIDFLKSLHNKTRREC